MKAVLDKSKNFLRSKFDQESKILIRNSSWVFVANAVGAVYAFLRSVIIARGLGAETLGSYTIAIAFVLTIQEILKLNVAMGVIRYGAQYRTENRPDKIMALLKGSVVASFASAALSVIVIAGLVELAYDHFLSTPGLDRFIILYALVNGFAFLDNIGKGVLKLYYKFRVNSLVQMVMDTFEFIMIALCIYFFKNDLSYFFTTVIVTRLINTLICNTAVILELKNELGPYLSTKVELIKDQYREISRFVVGNSFSNTLKTFMNQGDVLLLSMWSGVAAVGVYTVAKKLAYSVLTLTDPLVTSIFPQLSVLVAKKQFAEVRTMLIKLTRLTLLPVIAFLILAYFFRDDIITRIYGKAFALAADPFFIHLIGAIQGSIFFWCLPLIQSLGLTSFRFRVYLAAMTTGAITSWLLTPALGASGVAIGLLFANLVITSSFTWFAHQYMLKEQSDLRPV
ncbi:hypothetical protein BH11BAC2_BH11BAC2_25560 [soil metagenome]